MDLSTDSIDSSRFKQAAQKIIEAETQPIKKWEAKKVKEEAKFKLLQDFKSRFASLNKATSEISTLKKLRELKVDLGEGDSIVDVSIDKEHAATGKYLLEIQELAKRTSVITNGFETAEENIFGSGFIIFELGSGDEIEIFVDEENSSLKGISAAINNSVASPVTASVYKDDSDQEAPWKILLAGKKEGEINQLDIPDFYFANSDEDIYIEDDREAKNAVISINGFSIESESNDIPEFLEGVSLHIKQAKPETSFFLNISEDFQKISVKIKPIIDALNQILEFIEKQNSVDEKTDTTITFSGDTSFQSLEYKIRNIIQQPFSYKKKETGEINSLFLSQIGIEFEKTGQIALKEEKFNKFLENNFESVSAILSGPSGLSEQLSNLTLTTTRAFDGFISNKERGLKERIKQMDDQIDRKTKQVERKKEQIINQFSKLETTLSALQKQQQFLSTTLSVPSLSESLGNSPRPLST